MDSEPLPGSSFDPRPPSWAARSHRGELRIDEMAIGGRPPEQLVVPSAGDNPPALEYRYRAGGRDRRPPMGDDERGRGRNRAQRLTRGRLLCLDAIRAPATR